MAAGSRHSLRSRPISASTTVTVMQETRRYLASGAAVGEYLGDQLMLPMALAGGGSFSVESVSRHARTNAGIISLFLPVSFRFEQRDRHAVCTVERRA